MRFLITGGEFKNKGAEAMVFITIMRLRQFDPQAQIFMLGECSDSYADRLGVHCVHIGNSALSYAATGQFRHMVAHLVKRPVRWMLGMRSKELGPMKAKKFAQSCDFVLDVSGFALSSKFSINRSIRFLNQINCFSQNGAKVVLMPQSFGPFDYAGRLSDEAIKKTLSECAVIFARENSGFSLLKDKLKLINARKSFDLVLAEKIVDYSLVFKNNPQDVELPSLDSNNRYVGIVPNSMTLSHVAQIKDWAINVYLKIIEILRKHNYTPVLIPHAVRDIEICVQIKQRTLASDEIMLIDTVLPSYMYQELCKKLNFIIASRYHSIVHAYKESTPAVILGWAEKYQELAHAMGQEKYVFDFDNIVDERSILNAVSRMIEESEKERMLIKERLTIVQQQDSYFFLDKKED